MLEWADDLLTGVKRVGMKRIALTGAVVVLSFGAAGGVGYLAGSRSGEDLEVARSEGTAAGRERGTRVGEREGYDIGFRLGHRHAKREAYRRGYRIAYESAIEEAGLSEALRDALEVSASP